MLSLLRVFKNAGVDNFTIALNLLFDYLHKQPENVPQVMHCLIEGFGFKPDSYFLSFKYRKALLRICGSDQGKAKIFFCKAVCCRCRKVSAHTLLSTKSAKHHSITIINFDLPNTPPIKELEKLFGVACFNLMGTCGKMC